jgi:hypothetical protein
MSMQINKFNMKDMIRELSMYISSLTVVDF